LHRSAEKCESSSGGRGKEKLCIHGAATGTVEHRGYVCKFDDVFIGPFCYTCCLILPCRHCRKDRFSLQKNAEKYAISTLIFFLNLAVALVHTGEWLRRPFPDPPPSALRRFAPPRLAFHRRAPKYLPTLPVIPGNATGWMPTVTTGARGHFYGLPLEKEIVFYFVKF